MQPKLKKNQPNKPVDFFLMFEGLNIAEREVSKKKLQNNRNNNNKNNVQNNLKSLSKERMRDLGALKNNVEIRKLKKEQNVPIEKPFNKKQQAMLLGKSVEKSVVKKMVFQKEQDRQEVELSCSIGKRNKMSGVYYRDEDGELIRILNDVKSYDGYSMVNNHLLDLDYSKCRKMHWEDDFQHNFDQSIEEEFGHKAHVFIDNYDIDEILDGSEELDLRITLPGKMDTIEYKRGRRNIIKSEPGVFEFAVIKSLYEREGSCEHRFFNTRNGEFGAEGFGAEFRAEEERLLEYYSS